MANQLRSPRKIWILPDGDSRRAYQLKSQVGLDQHFETILWTPDGRLVYDSDEGGTYHIWRMRSDGSDQQQLTSGAAPDKFPTVSPDGNTIVFVSRRSGTTQLWRIDIDGRNPTQLTNFEGDTWRPQFMPDGQTIIFDSFVGGKARLWRVSVNGGEVSGVIDSDTGVWAISPDGGYLAFNYFDEHRTEHPILLQPLAPNLKTRSVDIYPETKLEWSRSGRGIFYNWNNDNKQNVWHKTLDASPPEPVTNFHDSDMVFNFNHSANGKDLAMIRYNVLTDAVLFRFKD
jgi:WD40 repeat protein